MSTPTELWIWPIFRALARIPLLSMWSKDMFDLKLGDVVRLVQAVQAGKSRLDGCPDEQESRPRLVGCVRLCVFPLQETEPEGGKRTAAEF